MIQRQSKNNDLVIQVEGTGIIKIEYYTDGLYKYVTSYSPTVCIPSQELQLMNDGQLRSTVYLSEDNSDFPDGTKDRTINQTFDIWIGDDKSNSTLNQYYTKEEIDQMFIEYSPDLDNYYNKDEVDSKIRESGTFDPSLYYTKQEVESKIPTDYLTEIPSEYITESELNSKGYLTEHQSLEGYSKTDHKHSEYLTEHQSLADYSKTDHTHSQYLTEHQSLASYALKSEIPDISNLATKAELTTAIGNIDAILDQLNGEVV